MREFILLSYHSNDGVHTLTVYSFLIFAIFSLMISKISYLKSYAKRRQRSVNRNVFSWGRRNDSKVIPHLPLIKIKTKNTNRILLRHFPSYCQGLRSALVALSSSNGVVKVRYVVCCFTELLQYD